ncbi:MAG: RING finger domain-containing protein [Candidatus Odinarchaeia archaeon]
MTESRFYISKISVIGTWDWGSNKCLICKSDIRPSQKKIYCPFCGSPYHRDHFLEWVKIKSFCPYCRRRINIEELVGD